jgi:hypothetical protein
MDWLSWHGGWVRDWMWLLWIALAAAAVLSVVWRWKNRRSARR